MSRSAIGNPMRPMPIQPIFCLAIVKLLCVAALSYSMIRKSGYRFSQKIMPKRTS